MAAQILTFYSYRGGAGRSMLLANIAWLLASNGRRVLAIDWDLEAPGLHEYFAPFLNAQSVTEAPGLIDWLLEQRAVRQSPGLPWMTETSHPAENARLLDYAIPAGWSFPDGGRLELVTAGRPGPEYARNVAGFDWEEFYRRYNGYDVIERLQTVLRRQYDEVLIDSRTGVTEMGGVCTVQLSDAIVLCVTLSQQSIDGASRMADGIDKQRRVKSEPGVRIFPVITRVEGTPDALARDAVVERFDHYLWHLPPRARADYWRIAVIPYARSFAFQERLYAFAEDTSDRHVMSAAIEQMTAYLTGGDVLHLPHLDPALRTRIRLAFARTGSGATCFLSYSSKDDAFAHKLHDDLSRAGIICWFAPHDLPIGARIRPGIEEAIRSHDKVILVLSAHAIASTWVEDEVETAFERERLTKSTILIPIRLDEEVLTTDAAWAANIRRQRNIGDFTDWENPAAYATALTRLLESLQPR
ncbi:MAG: hypothetical protein C5B51_03775 [Terriglobia bacterium]|nr:MAG: hypothetical protein C5B51_03775 [Terriglobia bacterium]